jgi:transglutaminase-like putative cysteine protease
VVSHLNAPPGRDEPLVVSLELVRAQAGAFDELHRRTSLVAGPDTVKLSAGPYPVSRDPVLPRYRRPSFVIDYDEPSVQRVQAEARRLCGPSPTSDQLARFVDHYIEHKDLLRGFDIASQVARRKEGDCTEHAVLLAALARAFGFTARVVLGMAIVSIGGKFEAVGHAWTEIHQAGKWAVADAALPPELGVRYLPMEVMEDEGQSFTRHMMETPNPILLVRRVVIDAPIGR